MAPGGTAISGRLAPVPEGDKGVSPPGHQGDGRGGVEGWDGISPRDRRVLIRGPILHVAME